MRCTVSAAPVTRASVVVSAPALPSRSWRFVPRALVGTQFVALGGLVWNFPTSCAWAARVYVSHR